MKYSFISLIALSAFAFAGNPPSAWANHYHHGQATSHIPETTISFTAASADLSRSAKQKLRDLISDARANGTIAEVSIAAWSDRELPVVGEVVPESERTLARKRAIAIERFLKEDLAVADTEIFNMAEHNNWLARMMNAKDAEERSVFSQRGAEVPLTNSEFRLIQAEGTPKHAVVLVECE